MKVLVVGSGGREHAILWKLFSSKRVTILYSAPGNPGMGEISELVEAGDQGNKALADFAEKEGIDLTVVGPESYLTVGIVDEFERRGLRIYGPSRAAAEIESSKIFAKELMKKYGIPTADYRSFDRADEAIDYIKEKGAPIVVKANGLAAGKGVIVAETIEEAVSAVDSIMKDRIFGEAGDSVVIEERLVGEEASVLAFTDGRCVVPMLPAQDHKPVYDGDRGPNTGGMGAYSPAPVITDGLKKRIYEEILIPVVRAMESEDRVYKGTLYAGLIITESGPKVIEFNARFGDPETQAVLPLLKSDLLDIFEAVVDNRLDEVEVEWYDHSSVCVIMASQGYPGDYERGKPIRGLEEARKAEDILIFHSGTRRFDDCLVTAGGRVLGVTAVGPDLRSAVDKAYDAVKMISFEGAHYRRDIAEKAFKHLPQK